MKTFNSTINNNTASLHQQKDGRFTVNFGYTSDGFFYVDERKVYATEKTALSKINKYIA